MVSSGTNIRSGYIWFTLILFLVIHAWTTRNTTATATTHCSRAWRDHSGGLRGIVNDE